VQRRRSAQRTLRSVFPMVTPSSSPPPTTTRNPEARCSSNKWSSRENRELMERGKSSHRVPADPGPSRPRLRPPPPQAAGKTDKGSRAQPCTPPVLIGGQREERAARFDILQQGT
jgi:hypothetical protein